MNKYYVLGNNTEDGEKSRWSLWVETQGRLAEIKDYGFSWDPPCDLTGWTQDVFPGPARLVLMQYHLESDTAPTLTRG